jgi:hypothetical protein
MPFSNQTKVNLADYLPQHSRKPQNYFPKKNKAKN